MEQALYVLLGGFLATLGGIIAQKYQAFINQKNEDMIQLIQIFDRLTDYKLYPSDSQKYDIEIMRIILRIRSKKYQSLVSEIVRFILIPEFKDKEKYIPVLVSKVRNAANKKVDEAMLSRIAKMGLQKNE